MNIKLDMGVLNLQREKALITAAKLVNFGDKWPILPKFRTELEIRELRIQKSRACFPNYNGLKLGDQKDLGP